MIGVVMFLAAYVLSNASLFRSVSALYYAKHLSLLAVAGLGASVWLLRGSLVARRRYVAFCGAISLISLPYLTRAVLTADTVEAAVFLQYVAFGIAVVAAAAALESRPNRILTRGHLIILAATAIVATITLIYEPYHLFNRHWGRPRLLLGFWHPKEIGGLLAVAVLLVTTRIALGVGRRSGFVIGGLLLLLLLFVDSRNMLLFSLIFPLAYLSARFGSYHALAIGATAALTFTVWFVSAYPLLADLLLSQRLTLWREAYYSLPGSGTALNYYEGEVLGKFNLDNFFVEYAVENGAYFVVLLMALVALVGYLVHATPDRRWKYLKLSAATAFVASAFFDAGMFSTGNIIHFSIWVYLLGGDRILVASAAADGPTLSGEEGAVSYGRAAATPVLQRAVAG